MKETDIILKSIMMHLLTSDNLEDAIEKVEVMLDEEMLAHVQKKANEINTRKKNK